MLLLLSAGTGLGRLIRIYSGLEHNSMALDQPTVQYGLGHGVSVSSSTRVVGSMHESSTITHYESAKQVEPEP